MTQMPQRLAYGAVDLSALKRPAAPAPPAGDGAPGGSGGSGVIVDVSEATFQAEVIDRSMTVPVVIDFWAEWCGPCKQLSPVLERFAVDDGGRWVLAKIDIDANQRLAAAAGVQSIPMVLAVVAGQPIPMFNGALPAADVRTVLDELLRVAEENGVSGRVAVEPTPDQAGAEPAPAEPQPPTPHEAAAQLLAAGDLEGAEAAYAALVRDAPGDVEAGRGAALVALARRVRDSDPSRVRADAAVRLDDVEIQCLAADVDLAAGDPAAAFDRLIAAVRRTSGEDRDRARGHLVTLFDIVGSSDPRVVKARAALASALF